MFILSNFMIKIDAEQTAVYNRYKQISFGSHFDRSGHLIESIPGQLKFIADPTLADKIKSEYYDEVFGLIIEYAQKYNGNIPIPEKFIGDAKIAQERNDEFGMWFADNCIKTDNGKIALEQICELSGFNKEVVKHAVNIDADLIAIMNLNRSNFLGTITANYEQYIITNDAKIPALVVNPIDSPYGQSVLFS